MPLGKVYISDFRINFALATIPGSLMQTVLDRSGQATALKIVCPQCAEPRKAGRRTVPGEAVQGKQVYVCESNPEHVFTSGEARRAKPIGTGKNAVLELVSPEQVEALKSAPLEQPENMVDLVGYRPAQVGSILKDGSCWAFVPDNRAKKAAVTLIAAMSERDTIFCGVSYVRGSEKWIQVEVVDGRIMVSGLVWPEQMADLPDPVAATPEPKQVQQAGAILDALTTNFDPEAIRSSARARHAALKEALASGAPAPVLPVTSQPVPADDAFAKSLLASLAK